MSDFELLMIVFTVLSLLIMAYNGRKQPPSVLSTQLSGFRSQKVEVVSVHRRCLFPFEVSQKKHHLSSFAKMHIWVLLLYWKVEDFLLFLSFSTQLKKTFFINLFFPV